MVAATPCDRQASPEPSNFTNFRVHSSLPAEMREGALTVRDTF